jgi:endoglucanase
MNVGWNLGNTFDAHWNGKPWGEANSPAEQEKMWGNPTTTKEMIDKIRATGFNTVRIPVTWYMLTGPGPDYTVDPALLDRVQEVVDYVIGNGMFCILNTHHEDYRSANFYCRN